MRLRCSVAEAINKVRETKLDLFSEQMDSYVNSVLELFHFVVDASRHQQHVQDEGHARKRDLQCGQAGSRPSHWRGGRREGHHEVAALGRRHRFSECSSSASSRP